MSNTQIQADAKTKMEKSIAALTANMSKIEL